MNSVVPRFTMVDNYDFVCWATTNMIDNDDHQDVRTRLEEKYANVPYIFEIDLNQNNIPDIIEYYESIEKEKIYEP